MALKKKVREPNGLTLEYHRVALIKVEPGQQITILRHSYVDEAARQYEKDYASGALQLAEGEAPQWPYVAHEYMHFDYAEHAGDFKGGIMDGDGLESGAYRLMKKLDRFEGAQDA